VLPVVLVIKNWDTTLKAIKMLLKFVMTSTPKVIKFITIQQPHLLEREKRCSFVALLIACDFWR
jgi:hypothetical protein